MTLDGLPMDHRELLLNWFQARGEIAMGAVEGMNNKARVTTKLAYGFRAERLHEKVPASISATPATPTP